MQFTNHSNKSAVFTLRPLDAFTVSVFSRKALGGYVMSVWCLVFLSHPSKWPWKVPRLVSNTSVYRTDSAFLLSYKRLLTPEPDRSGLLLQRRTCCVINGEQLQGNRAHFNKVENVYPVKPMQADGLRVSHPSDSLHCADKDVYVQKWSLCILLH